MLDELRQDAKEAAQAKNLTEKEPSRASIDEQVRREFPFIPAGLTLGDALMIMWAIIERDDHHAIEAMATRIRNKKAPT